MKKLLMFLVVVLTFSVSACGSGEKNIAPDYADEVAFEKALNSGENVTGKTVVFIAASLHPGSKLGYNIWSGEHLNFITSSNPGIKEGHGACRMS